MPEHFIVVGPNGSDKSSALFETQIDKSIVFVSPNNIARGEYANIEDPDVRDKPAWLNRNAKLAQGLLQNS